MAMPWPMLAANRVALARPKRMESKARSTRPLELKLLFASGYDNSVRQWVFAAVFERSG